MDEAPGTATSESAESGLRQALDRDDEAIAAIAPVLRRLLTNDDLGLFSDESVARVRGMTTDIARQLLDRLPADDAHDHEGRLTRMIMAVQGYSPFLRHAHALALEWQLTERLHVRLSIDPVLSPLLQALIGSPDPETAALAMQALAAQARFSQAQRRMALPLGELPGDLLYGVIVAMRAAARSGIASEGQAKTAEASIREEYDERRSRLGLLSRLVIGMGPGAAAALSIGHAGAALFLTALASLSRQERDLAVLSTSQAQETRLALSLRATGLAPAAIDEQFLVVHPDASPPAPIRAITADRAAALLAAVAGYGGA